jgi:hypothetical protein
MKNYNSHINVFCDGGIGNRINSLISGIAIANHFNIKMTVYWPTNSWCAAAFEDIFSNDLNIKNEKLNEVKDKFANSNMMLHDEIGANLLGVSFASAYAYNDMEDFEHKTLQNGRDIFFYPAIIPEWIPVEMINAALKQLSFTENINLEVNKFIVNIIKKPFHGIHLRRTDLKVGLTDLEVMKLVQKYPNETFFVCSDDPDAENLATAHPNVFARKKTNTVEKKSDTEDWISPSKDEEGRLSYGNIQRSKEAMIEGTIDLLILSHSQIVGYSGSTFQRISRLIGDQNPIVNISRPQALPFISGNEIKKQLQSKVIAIETLLYICNSIANNGDTDLAIELLQESTLFFEGNDLNNILHNLAIHHLNKGQAQLSQIYFKHLAIDQTNNYSLLLHIAYTEWLLKNFEQAIDILNNSLIQNNYDLFNESEKFIFNLLNEKLNHLRA